MKSGLNLESCRKFTDKGLKPLKNMTHDLNIRSSSITNKALKYLQNMTCNLDISFCNGITDDGL